MQGGHIIKNEFATKTRSSPELGHSPATASAQIE
jgi:hypothetical protein